MSAYPAYLMQSNGFIVVITCVIALPHIWPQQDDSTVHYPQFYSEQSHVDSVTPPSLIVQDLVRLITVVFCFVTLFLRCCWSSLKKKKLLLGSKKRCREERVVNLAGISLSLATLAEPNGRKTSLWRCCVAPTLRRSCFSLLLNLWSFLRHKGLRPLW